MNMQTDVFPALALPAPGSCFSGRNGAAWALWEPGHPARRWESGSRDSAPEGRTAPARAASGQAASLAAHFSARWSHKQTV